MHVPPGPGGSAQSSLATPSPKQSPADRHATIRARHTSMRRLRRVGSSLEVRIGVLLVILLAVAVIAGIAASAR